MFPTKYSVLQFCPSPRESNFKKDLAPSIPCNIIDMKNGGAVGRATFNNFFPSFEVGRQYFPLFSPEIRNLLLRYAPIVAGRVSLNLESPRVMSHRGTR